MDLERKTWVDPAIVNSNKLILMRMISPLIGDRPPGDLLAMALAMEEIAMQLRGEAARRAAISGRPEGSGS